MCPRINAGDGVADKTSARSPFRPTFAHIRAPKCRHPSNQLTVDCFLCVTLRQPCFVFLMAAARSPIDGISNAGLFLGSSDSFHFRYVDPCHSPHAHCYSHTFPSAISILPKVTNECNIILIVL
jgi:hypothetical protein